MVDPIDALERALAVAITIAEDTAQKPSLRLQAVSATTRAASALAAVSGAQHTQEEKDILWLSRTIERPSGTLPGPAGAMVEGLRLSRASRILEGRGVEQQKVPNW